MAGWVLLTGVFLIFGADLRNATARAWASGLVANAFRSNPTWSNLFAMMMRCKYGLVLSPTIGIVECVAEAAKVMSDSSVG